MTFNPTLLTDASGKTGSRVPERLRAAGRDVRPGSRRTPIPFNWTLLKTWSAALDGMASVYVNHQPNFAFAGAIENLGAFTRTAGSAGVGRLGMLSGRGERTRSTPSSWHRAESPSPTS